MSFHRANVTWHTPNGAVHIGFFTVIEPDERDDDYDSEWDVDYDDDSFEDVYHGWTEKAAWAAVHADRPNPGSSQCYYADRPEDANAIAGFNRMAVACPNHHPKRRNAPDTWF